MPIDRYLRPRAAASHVAPAAGRAALEDWMIWRAVAVWFGILVLANINGAARQVWLIPWIGETAGRVASTLALCGIVVLLTWRTIRWIGPATAGRAVRIGVVWLGLTLAFEFLVGHYVFGQPWSTLLEDYDITRGRVWPLALLVVLFAPVLAAHLKGLFRVHRSTRARRG